MPKDKTSAPELTVRQLLLQSLPKGEHFCYNNGEAHTKAHKFNAGIKQLDESLNKGGKNNQGFRIRSAAITSTEALDAIKSKLNGTSSLYTPSYIFVGPKVSQTLFTIANDELNGLLNIRMGERYEHRPLFSFKPILDIVPHHRGDDLHAFLAENKDNRIRLIKELANHPEKLERIFDIAAFVAVQPLSPERPDMHAGNIMVRSKSLTLSLVDMVSPEHIDYSTPTDTLDANRRYQRARTYLSDGGSSLATTLKSSLYSNHPQSGDEYHLNQKINEIAYKTLEKVRTGALEKEHPNWKGFVEVQNVKAVSLDAPATDLFKALNETHQQAVQR